MHGAAPRTQNYLTPNINKAKADEPGFRGWDPSWRETYFLNFLLIQLEMPSFPSTIYGKDRFTMEWSWRPCQKSMTTKVQAEHPGSLFRPPVHAATSAPAPRCFDYCSSVESSDIRKQESSNFVLFQDGFDSAGPWNSI